MFRVVVVDDEAPLRQMLTFLLECDGRFEVVGDAGDGAEAIAEAERAQPDAIVLDHMMPMMSGLEALPEIRRVAPGATVLVYSAVECETAAVQAGAAGWFPKGTRVDELPDALAALLEETGGRGTVVDLRPGRTLPH